MLAQLVGAGALIKLLLGLEYWLAVIIVGVMMTIYVLFGGMTATSWVQIIKAVLLMAGTIIISFLVFLKFEFNIFKMFAEMTTATPHGEAYLHSGVQYTNPLNLISTLIALILGTSGLPHILMRFFTVKRCENSSFFCNLCDLDYRSILCNDDFLRFWCSEIRWSRGNCSGKLLLVTWQRLC